MFDKKIKFVATEKEMVDIWPNPKPASREIPEEYKKMNRFHNKDYHLPTLKTCMPFLDAMTAGYIMYFDQDYLVDPVENSFSVTPANKRSIDFGYHDEVQMPEQWQKIAGEKAGKFHNKWLIKTPPGYSCLFIKPMNRIEERFEIISGIVDTDTYINQIHFPFLLRKKDEQFIINKGEPMIQVIPFKRESWKSWVGFYYEKLHLKTLDMVETKWMDRYKKMFWFKKNFK
jgi:hypothetical protein